MHLIEGYLSLYKNYDSSNHVERLKEIYKDSVLKPIYTKYKTVYDQSIRARYFNHTFTIDDIGEINNCYREIEKCVKPKIEPQIRKIEESVN